MKNAQCYVTAYKRKAKAAAAVKYKKKQARLVAKKENVVAAKWRHQRKQ